MIDMQTDAAGSDCMVSSPLVAVVVVYVWIEYRELLEEVSAFEKAEFASESEVARPVPLRFDSFDDRLSETQRVVSLSMVLCTLHSVAKVKGLSLIHI